MLPGLGDFAPVRVADVAEANGRTLRLWGFLARPDGSRMVRAHVEGDDPQEVGDELAQQLLDWGGAPLSVR